MTMEFKDCFPIWDELSPEQQHRLSLSVTRKMIGKGTLIHRGALDCTGLLLVQSGQRLYSL